jgi:hypothetical protein
MTMFQDVNAEELARLFHHYQTALMQNSKSPADEAPTSWDRASHTQRKVLVTAARLALLELARSPEPSSPERKYYAKPGEADWGC